MHAGDVKPDDPAVTAAKVEDALALQARVGNAGPARFDRPHEIQTLLQKAYPAIARP